MFSRVEAILGDKLISDPNGLYGIQAYITDLCSRGHEAQKYWFPMQGWYERDTTDKFAAVVAKDTGENNAIFARH